FFQAEDGIRDFHVTGVQTCALPISSWPLQAGLHTCYNGVDSGQLDREVVLISKRRLSSDCSLQLESMKAESLVIADQHAAVNTFPGLVHTARHTMGVGFTRRRYANPQGGPA